MDRTLQPHAPERKPGYQSRGASPRYRCEAPRGPPIGWTGDSRAALRRHRRRPDRARRRAATSTLPDGVPGRGEGGATRRSSEHGDYATNVALQLGQEGRHAAARARRAARRASSRQRRRRSPPSRSPARASSTSRSTAGAQGEVARATSSRPGRRTARTDAVRRRRRSTSSSSPPTRPARSTSAASAGPRSATPGPGLRGRRRRGHPGVLLQRPRRADRPVRALAAAPRAQGKPAPEDGYGGAYIDEIADAVVAERPDVLDLPDDEAQEVFRASGVDLMFAEIKQTPARASASTSTSTSTRTDLHESGAVRAGDRPADASWATPTRPTARSGCAPSSSATTRTG